MIVLPLLILFLLCLIFIITSYAKENTYLSTMSVFEELSIAGGALVLSFIILAVAKTYLRDMIHQWHRIWLLYQKVVIRNKNCEHIVILCGTKLVIIGHLPILNGPIYKLRPKVKTQHHLLYTKKLNNLGFFLSPKFFHCFTFFF